jgi:23S rRNA pseudouridine1911/1915/1917 synthase
MQISDHILHKNNRFVVFNKPAGIPVVPDLTKDMAVTQILAAYLKHDVHPVHRIDRPASGLVLLGQSAKDMAELSRLFAEGAMKKTYLAVVKNAPSTQAGTLVHFMKKTGATNKMQLFDQPTPGAQEARLAFEVIAKSDQFHLLKIDLQTGRQHQIRAQLAAIGCPIKGDNKYGYKRSNEDRSIHLHAWQLEFVDPANGELLHFEAPIPQTDVVWQYFAVNKTE